MKPSPSHFVSRASGPCSRVTTPANWSMIRTAAPSPSRSAKAVKSFRSQNRIDTSTAPGRAWSPASRSAPRMAIWDASRSIQRRWTPVSRVSHREQSVERLRCREHAQAVVEVRRLQPRLNDADPELHRCMRDPREQPPVDAPELDRELERPDLTELPQLIEDPRLLGRERGLVGGWKREAESLHQFADPLNRQSAGGLDLIGAHRPRGRPSGGNDLRDPGLGIAALDRPRDRGL